MTDPLVAAVARVNAATTELDAALEARDDAIREALKTLGPTAIANATGLTRDRIYQIKERRR